MEVARRLRGVEDSAAEAAKMAEFNEKKWVWVPDEKLGYVAGWVLSEGKGPSGSSQLSEVVLADGGEHRTLPNLALHPMNPPKFDLAEDIADLTYLNEAGVVDNLRRRYEVVVKAGGKASMDKGGIYTYSGLFLISLNPYTPLPIYTPQIVASYRNKRREEVAPHIFAIAERAWIQMGEQRECQSVLITGESGAGKTENTKKVIQYLAAIASSSTDPIGVPKSQTSTSLASSSSSTSIAPAIGLPRTHSFKGKDSLSLAASSQGESELGLLEQQILQANPILEAFGNAQTLRNNNSSRFGKFIRISFSPTGAIAGANIDWYLLEKSRVTGRSEGERSFHVFYQLLKGKRATELRSKLLLSEDPADYKFLNKGRTTIDGVDDAEEYRLLKSALNTVGFSIEEQFDIFRIVATILHIGNIDISGDSSDQAHIPDYYQVEKVCQLLGVDVKEFMRAVLRPTVKAGRETVTQARTKRQAEDELAALCKTMYEKTFGGIVDRINQALDRPSAKSLFIGVLDIAGFEIFDVNGYEQLLINFTNERLQQFFNHHMFVLEQEEYSREGIEWNFVNFGLDLQPTIELIESNQPIGILATLDEECIMPKATDMTFLQKLKTQWEPSKGSDSPTHPGSTKFSTPRFGGTFVVQHYAGRVEYDTTGWLQKNKDPINDNVARLLAQSSIPAVASSFSEYSDRSGASVTAGKRVKRGAFRTVAQRHKEQLTSLMTQLQSTQPHFVRCIVPNPHKQAGVVDVPLVLDQLRCNGVLEGIRIARLGYPNRLPFTEFRQRYEVLTPSVIPKGYLEGRKACIKMIEALELPSTAFKVGNTKIFFKAGVLAELEDRRDAQLYDIFANFQSAARMFVARRKMKRLLNRALAIKTIQRNARTYIQLRDWPWWQLYTKVRPLLAATRQEEEIASKKAELLLAQQLADRERQEKAALAELQAKLASEKQQVENALDAEKQMVLERDASLEKARQTENEMAAEISALEGDIDQLEQELEAMTEAKRVIEAHCENLVKELGQSTSLAEGLSQQETAWQRRAAESSEKLLEAEQALKRASSEQSALQLVIEEERGKSAKLEDALKRFKEKLEAASQAKNSEFEAERLERQSAQTKVKSLEVDSRAKDERVTALTAAAAAFETSVKKKEAEVAALKQELSTVASEADSIKKTELESKLLLENLKKELDGALSKRKQLEEADKNNRAELDGLRRLLATKSSEATKQAEADRSREQELANLRKQSSETAAQLESQRKQSQKAMDDIKLQLEDVQQKHRSLTQSSEATKRALASAERELEDKAAAVAAKTTLERELSNLRARHISVEQELADSKSGKEALDKQVVAMKGQLQDYEEAVMAIETERSTWTKRIETTAKELRAETSRREALEVTSNTQGQELVVLKSSAEDAQRKASKLAMEMQGKDAELALLKSRENKTIVEHVHVLEKAKRMTDRELAHALAEKERLATLLRSADQVKAKTASESEELLRSNEQLKAELRRLNDDYGVAAKQDKAARQAAEQALESTNSKLKRSQARIQTLEQEQQEQQIRPKPESYGRSSSRLLKELQSSNERLVNEMDQELRRGELAKKKSFENFSRNNVSASEDPTGVGSQQISLLESRIAASENVRKHLQLQVDEITRDLESSDGSKESLQATRAKLLERNRRLASLLASEAEKQKHADAANISTLQDVWGLFRSHMQEERTKYSALENSKREHLSQQHGHFAEVDELNSRLQDAQLKIKRLQSQQSSPGGGMRSVRAERQAASTMSEFGDERAMIELESRLRDERALSDTHLARAENAEREISSVRNQFTKTQRALGDLKEQLEKRTEQYLLLEKRQRLLEGNAEDRSLSQDQALSASVRKGIEAEHLKYQKDLQDRDFTIAQTRSRYQTELATLSEEQGQLRDQLSKLREDIRSTRAREQALRLQLDQELHSSASWKLHKDRLENRIADLTKAFEGASADCADAQTQVAAYIAEIRDLRSKGDELDAECAALLHAKQRLEERVNQGFDKQIESSRFSRDQMVQQLNMDKAELKTAVESMSDQVQLMVKKAAKSDSYAAECLEELSKARQANAQLDQQNSSLERIIKDLNLKIVDLTTQAYASSPKPISKRLEQQVEHLKSNLESETQEKNDALRAQRSLERSLREKQAEAKEWLEERAKLKQHILGSEEGVKEIIAELDKARSQQAELTLVNKRQERAIADLRMTIDGLTGGKSLPGTPLKSSMASPRRG